MKNKYLSGKDALSLNSIYTSLINNEYEDSNWQYYHSEINKFINILKRYEKDEWKRIWMILEIGQQKLRLIEENIGGKIYSPYYNGILKIMKDFIENK